MQRQFYNAALEERIGAYRTTGKSPSLVDQMRSLTVVRAEDPGGYGALPTVLSRWSLKKLDLAFVAFFARVRVKKGKAGFPRFRGKAGWRSFGFREFSGIRLVGDCLKFSAFGRELSLRVHMHRPLPAGAAVKSCVFTKDGRRWLVALQIEAPSVATVHPFAGRAVGLDWGVENLATLSDGSSIANPRLGRGMAREIASAQRTLARRRKGSRRREKAKAHLRSLQRRLARRRRT